MRRLCLFSPALMCFPPEVIFHSRVLGACPVATDCIVAMSQCETNSIHTYREGLRAYGLTVRRCVFFLQQLTAVMQYATKSS